MVLDLCQVLQDTFCDMFFDKFFNSPTLIQKLHDKYGLGRALSDRINMPQMKKDKEMKRGDYQCKFYNHIACIKWYNNMSVMLLGSHLEEVTSILTIQKRLKGSSSKILVTCSNDIKLYNSKIGGVDLMHQLKSAYQTYRRSKFRFYLRLFFICSMLLLQIFLLCIRNWRTKI